MTEEQWLACTDPEAMLTFIAGTASDRKLQLFAAACSQRIFHLLDDTRSRDAVVLAELFADRQASREELNAIAAAARAALVDGTRGLRPEDEAGLIRAAARNAAWGTAISSLQRATKDAAWALGWASRRAGAEEDEMSHQCHLLRDIFGNPFRPVALDPAWLTPAVVSLARTVYDERAWGRLPELADLLEGAGCRDPEVLGHCRGPGTHVRGCWVVDLILGKS